MCGIFGLICKDSSRINYKLKKKIINDLFILSESRGKESSGVSVKCFQSKSITVIKNDIIASKFIREKTYNDLLESKLKNNSSESLIVSGHARMVTNGSNKNNNNNQPVIKKNNILVHNGIVTNVDKLWSINRELNRQYFLDSEIIISLIEKYRNLGFSKPKSIQKVFDDIEGMTSIALFNNIDYDFILCSNNGSLYYSYSNKINSLIFSSEKFILNKVISDNKLISKFKFSNPQWLNPTSLLIIDILNFKKKLFDLNTKKINIYKSKTHNHFKINNLSKDKLIKDFKPNEYNTLKDNYLRKLLEYNIEKIDLLKRCNKCYLPETFPFIKFDSNGICSICSNYISKAKGGKDEEFKTLMKKYQSKTNKPDCIVPFSGGRDSSYSLHYIVNELELKPLTYTYDWGMVTDLARRNISRMCGKLGIENILISADIKRKRENIHKNVKAWLKRPELGMIPLFMAGDKQFFYYVNKIKKETGIKLDIWSMNRFEDTQFKSGFSNVRPEFDKKGVDSLSLSSKIRMVTYYLKNFILNPSYINTSLLDTMSSYYSYYIEKRHDFYQIFDFIKWDESSIENILLNEYNWELSNDTTTSWRIGDGTASFYNYIYYTVAGFSEFDTFRSHQIREGQITRGEAKRLINVENQPRFESLRLYLETINIDFERAIKKINKIPKLYDN